MSEDIQMRLAQLNDEAIALGDEVSAALESGEDSRQVAAWRRVQELARHYGEVMAEVGAADAPRIERQIGRRITDLRRQAEGLTKKVGGTKAERAVDAGQVPFLERRAPPKSIEPQRGVPTRGFSVGGEVEAWCGKCRDFSEHRIVAMVGAEPKQVLCTRCNSRHGYRTEPSARSLPSKETATPAPAVSAPRRPVDPRAAKLAEAKRQLIAELDAAVDPRAFDPRARYKANEIIVHPEYGRGKIENVMRSSLLVRFREGLRPLQLK